MDDRREFEEVYLTWMLKLDCFLNKFRSSKRRPKKRTKQNDAEAKHDSKNTRSQLLGKNSSASNSFNVNEIRRTGSYRWM
jgi:hypothetical protein